MRWQVELWIARNGGRPRQTSRFAGVASEGRAGAVNSTVVAIATVFRLAKDRRKKGRKVFQKRGKRERPAVIESVVLLNAGSYLCLVSF